MLSKVAICNMALSHFAQSRQIMSLDEATAEARQLNLFYDQTRREVLASYAWRFARAVVAVAPVAAEHPLWRYVFAMPSDCVRVLGVIDLDKSKPGMEQYEDFEVGRVHNVPRAVMSDVENAALVYTYDVSDPLEFPPAFAEVLSWKLAVNIAIPLSGTASLRDSAMQHYTEALQRAILNDANDFRKLPVEWDKTYVTARD